MVEWGGTAQVLKSEMNVPTCCLNRRLVSRPWSGVAYLGTRYPGRQVCEPQHELSDLLLGGQRHSHSIGTGSSKPLRERSLWLEKRIRSAGFCRWRMAQDESH
jgi:hypothetical protein